MPSLLLYSVNYEQVCNKSNTFKGRQIKLHLLKGEISKNLWVGFSICCFFFFKSKWFFNHHNPKRLSSFLFQDFLHPSCVSALRFLGPSNIKSSYWLKLMFNQKSFSKQSEVLKSVRRCQNQGLHCLAESDVWWTDSHLNGQSSRFLCSMNNHPSTRRSDVWFCSLAEPSPSISPGWS